MDIHIYDVYMFGLDIRKAVRTFILYFYFVILMYIFLALTMTWIKSIFVVKLQTKLVCIIGG